MGYPPRSHHLFKGEELWVKVSQPNSSLLMFMVGLVGEIVSLRTFPCLKAQEMGLEKDVCLADVKAS